MAHPSGLPALCIVIETDGGMNGASCRRLLVISGIEPGLLLQRIRTSGIVGLGGASLSPMSNWSQKERRIDTLVINAAE